MKTEKVSNARKEVNCPVIDIEISNVVLIPYTCASLANEYDLIEHINISEDLTFIIF